MRIPFTVTHPHPCDHKSPSLISSRTSKYQNTMELTNTIKTTTCTGCDGTSSEHSCKPASTALVSGNFLTNDAMKIFGEAMGKQMTDFQERQIVVQDKKMQEMALLFSQKLNNVDSRLTDMEEKINNIKGTTANSSDSMYLDRVTRDVWQIIPALFNSKTGTCAWVPVEYVDEEGTESCVIVVSLRMLQLLVPKFNPGISKNAIKCCFDSLGSANIDIRGASGRCSSGNFESIMTKTPFRTYQVGKSMYIKGNISNYMILSADYWKGVLGDIERLYPNRKVSGTDITTLPSERVYMTQRFAMKAVSKTDSRTPKIKEFGNKQFSLDERMKMPAMFVPWWSELYNSAVRYFFSIPSECEKFGAIVDGKYVGEQESVIPTFEETFEKIFPGKPHLKYDQVEESDDESDSDDSDEEENMPVAKRPRKE